MKKALAAVVAIMVGFSLFSESVTASPYSINVPEEGAYIGAFADFGFMGDFVTYEMINKFEKLSGRRLAMISMGSFWGKEEFPGGQVKVIKGYGAIPIIYWHPWGPPYNTGEFQQRYSMQSIIEGRHDDYIKQWARGAKSSGTPLIVCFAPDMNNDALSWSGYYNGAGETTFGNVSRLDGPERYVFAYRHVVDIFRSLGVKNVQWLFHVDAQSSPNKEWNNPEAYYPGDSYVDWIGISAFGKRVPAEEWVSFEEIFDSCYLRLSEIAPSKPMLVQLAVGEFEDGSKAEWIEEAYRLIKEKYVRVKAAVWWQENWMDDDNVFCDLGIDSSDDVLVVFRRAIQDPYFIDRP